MRLHVVHRGADRRGAIHHDGQRYTAREIEACNWGSSAATRSTVSMMFAPGCRKMITSTAGFPLVSPMLRRSSTDSLDTSRRRARRTAASVAVGHDQRPDIPRRG